MVGRDRVVGLKMMPSMVWLRGGCWRGRAAMVVSAERARQGWWEMASSGMLGICLFSGFGREEVGSEKVRVGTASLLPPAPRQNSLPVLAVVDFDAVASGKPPKVPNVVPDRSSSGNITPLSPFRS